MVWSGISYNGSSNLYAIRNWSMVDVRYYDEILLPIGRPYAGAIDNDFILKDDNTRTRHARIVN